jgi:hypothetical protein
MLEHLPIALAIIAGFGGVCLFVRWDTGRQLDAQTKVLTAERKEAMAEHERDCTARGRAIATEDDSGAVQARVWSPSGSLPR